MYATNLLFKIGCHGNITQTLLCLTLSQLAFILLTIQSELNYRDNCGDGIASQCNQSKLLVCSHYSICDCTEHKTYDTERNKCVTELGRTCLELPEVDCPQHASCAEKDYVSSVRLPKQLVKSLSTRDSSVGGLRCNCNLGYTADSKECKPVLLFGENCTIPKYGPDSCDLTRNLLCSQATNTCSCTRKILVYDDGLKACVSPLGVKCNGDLLYPDQCLQNGICYKTYKGYIKPFKISKYIDQLWNDGEQYKEDESVCICLPGYRANSFGICVGLYNAQCSVTDPCNTERFLECVNGVCRCSQGRNMEYRPGIYSKCMLLPGATCWTSGKANATAPSCIPECSCKHGKCKIENAESWKKRFGVKLSHGQNCTTDDSGGRHICDASAGLACIGESSCDCFDQSLSWSVALQRCVAKLGEACGHFSPSEDIQHITFHPLLPRTIFNQLPSPDEPFYVGCPNGFLCIYQPNELASLCINVL